MSSYDSSEAKQFDHFPDFLSRFLSVGTKLRVYHLSTRPVPSPSIFAAPPGRPDEPTTCESHFLTISQPHVTGLANVDHHPHPNAPANGNADGSSASHVLVLGIEVLIFSTESLTTIFVSKADSTGFLSRSAESQQGSSSITRVVITAFLEWLVSQQFSELTPAVNGNIDQDLDATSANHARTEARVDGGPNRQGVAKGSRTLVLSLFARSQNQYIFPGSIENTTKHVLDDRQLIKWWCRVLDNLVQKNWPARRPLNISSSPARDGYTQSTAPENAHSTLINLSPGAYVVVPGCDRSETVRSFFPTSARHPSSTTKPKWHNAYPAELLADRKQISAETPIPVRCMIPRLPDDPKSRYCNDLDDAGVDDLGRWRDIRTLQQFWETMEYRQECAAGRLVGFVWVVFKADAEPTGSEVQGQPLTDTTYPATRSERAADGMLEHNQCSSRPELARVRPTMVTSEHYNTLSDLMVNDLDFAGVDLAAQSTRVWIDMVKELAYLQEFGVDVEGRNTDAPTKSNTIVADVPGTTLLSGKHSREEDTIPPVNVLTGVRKKRQRIAVHDQPESGDNSETNGEVVKPVTKDTQAKKDIGVATNSHNTSSGDVKTLSAGLVRKRPKPTVD